MTGCVDESTMDGLDQKLLALLRGNARESIAVLARKLDVSRGTVTNRIRRLEDAHVIVGYTVVLKPLTPSAAIHAWMGIEVEGNQSRAVVDHLLGEPALVALHDTNGRWDLLAEISASTTADLSKVLERIRLIRGIRSSETNIHLASYR
jgi:DNA-binding Lrp family transcriptional regulator